MAIDTQFSPEEKPGPDTSRLVFTDPWADLDTGRQRRDNWMLSYIDMLTLLLTLFVILLVLQPKHEPTETKGLPETADLATIQIIERRPPAPSKDSVQSLPFEEPAGSVSDLALPLHLGKEAARQIFEPKFSITGLTLEPLAPMRPSMVAKPVVNAPMKTGVRTPKATRKEKEVSDARASAKPVKPKPSETTELDGVMAGLTRQGLDKRLKVSRKSEGIHLEVRDNVLFAEASAELKPEGLHLLAGLAGILLRHQGIISVEGHTDNRPISNERFPSNWELSSARATTVTRELIAHGLDSGKLRAVGYADTRPLESNSTSKGRARNRRVSLILESLPAMPLAESTSH